MTAIVFLFTSLVPAAVAAGAIGTLTSAVNSSDDVINGLPSVPSGSEVQAGIAANDDGTYSIFIDADRDGNFDAGSDPQILRTPAAADLKIVRSGTGYALIDDKDHDGVAEGDEILLTVIDDEDADGDGDTNADEIAGGVTPFATLTGWLNPAINLGDSDGDSWTNADEDCHDPGETPEEKTWYADDQLPESLDGFDTDGDGVADDSCVDASNPENTLAGDEDDDGDAVLDADDDFPKDSLEWNDNDADQIGDNADTDDDNDGYGDALEFAHGTSTTDASSKPLDTDGDLTPNEDAGSFSGDTDDDNDAHSDAAETAAGSDPLDVDSTPETCDGSDNDLNDGVDEGFLNTDGDSDANCVDTDDDNDTFADENDAFPLDSAEWLDTDGDSTGNNADLDDDGDSVSDADEIAAGSDSLNAASTPEACDGSDNDLNDGVDEGFLNTDGDADANCVDLDDDADGFADSQETTEGSNPLDVNSTPETCDGSDNDLDLSVDEGFVNTDGDSDANCVDTDDDNDTFADENDAFPLDSAEWLDTDGDSTGNNADLDDDGDSVSDVDEIDGGSNPLNADSTPETCDGSDNDLDNSTDEGFPNTDGDADANCMDADDDGDSVSDVDEIAAGSDPLDVASVPETCDGSDNDLNEGVDEGFTNTDGDAEANCVDTDDDNDTHLDVNDAFPLDSTEWLDTDGDSTGNNADTDDDGDSISDADEVSGGSNPLDAASTPEVCDGSDNDLDASVDEGFLNTDGDGDANCVDTDDDNDSVVDGSDAFPLDAAESLDTDADGTGNNADTDDDGDSFDDATETDAGSSPVDAASTPEVCDGSDNDLNEGTDEGFVNTDGDAQANCVDLDDDNDGVDDTAEIAQGTNPLAADTDADGAGDATDNCGTVANADQRNLDGDDLGNACDADMDDDGLNDGLTGADVDKDDDADGFTDAQERAARSDGRDERSTPTDLDGDGIPNAVDSQLPEETILAALPSE